MIDPNSVNKIPPPPGAKKGHWNSEGIAPVWIEDGPDFWLWIKRAGLVAGLLVAVVTVVMLLVNFGGGAAS